MNAPSVAGDVGPLDLLVIQPTPFCNIDCSYCYLPDRQSRKRIAPEVLDCIFARVFESDLVASNFTVIWHAGEPLVLPPDFYAHALDLLDRHNTRGVPVFHSFQTNGTLIDEEWCQFINARKLRVGVSVDGPAFLHDRCRKTRQGKGTFDRAVRGMRLLRAHAIPFHVITVLTRASLDYADEMYAFYRAEGIERVGFNIEEIEGPNTSSSLQAEGARAAVTRFLARFYDLAAADGWPLRVREIDGALAALACPEAGPPRSHERTPLAIVSVDCEGNFSTFSPELLGLRAGRYDDFTIGRVQTDSFADALRSAKLQALRAEVEAGMRRCEQTCDYYPWCGGGSPANKVFENGTFDSAETMFCRLGKQAVLDVVLSRLEGGPIQLATGPSSFPPTPEAHEPGGRLSLL